MDKDEVKAIRDRLSVPAKFILSQMDEGVRYSVKGILNFFTELSMSDGTDVIEEVKEFDPKLVRVESDGMIQLTIIGSMVSSDTMFYKEASNAMAARTADVDQDLASGEQCLMEILDDCDPRTLTQIVRKLESIQADAMKEASSIDEAVERFVGLFGVIKFNAVLARWVQICADNCTGNE